MSTATSRELIEQAIEATNRRAVELVEAARQRRERDQRRRAEFAAARRAGLGYRNAQKLANLRSPEGHADPDATPAVPVQPSHARDLGTGPDQDARRRAGTHAQGEGHV